jgi:hypothetical protein
LTRLNWTHIFSLQQDISKMNSVLKRLRLRPETSLPKHTYMYICTYMYMHIHTHNNPSVPPKLLVRRKLEKRNLISHYFPRRGAGNNDRFARGMNSYTRKLARKLKKKTRINLWISYKRKLLNLCTYTCMRAHHTHSVYVKIFCMASKRF